ncbi:MAG TPA: hypothetical protein VF534_18465 [Paraburkholderia sp.]
MKREIKLGISSGNAPEAAVAARTAALKLLDRSIRFGHCRLAVIRFVTAAEVGAAITPDQVRYCEDAVAICNDASLGQSFAVALKRLFTFGPSDPL